jgi:hypothetical protein
MKQMKQIEFNPMRLLAGACGLITLLALTMGAVAQQAASAASKIAAAPAATKTVTSPTAKAFEEKEEAAPNSPNQQGIKVHGHWVLQVKNADGTLGERREFENSLVAPSSNTNAEGFISGNQLLGLLLAGNAVPGDPAVIFVSAPSGGTLNPPPTYYDCSVPGQATCDAVYTNNSGIFYNIDMAGSSHFASGSTGLTSTVNLNPTISWVLNGNLQVQAASSHSMSYVQTMIPLCLTNTTTIGNSPNDYSYLATAGMGGASNWGGATVESFSGGTGQMAPNACTTWASFSGGVSFAMMAQFTYTAIPGGPLTTATGQVITVTVTISFS